MAHDALALIELDSIARGYKALDALVKKSPVHVLEANLVEPGRYLVLFCGGVAEVDEAYAEGIAVGAECVVDQLLLPMVHEDVVVGLAGQLGRAIAPDTIGIVEATSISATLHACDRSLKDAGVLLAGLRITPALGGKGYFVVYGVQHDVEAALETAEAVLEERERLLRVELVPRPHPDFLAQLLRPAPFAVTDPPPVGAR